MGSKWTTGVPGNYMERTDGGHGRKNFMLNRERDSGGENVQIWNRLDPAAERSPAGGRSFRTKQGTISRRELKEWMILSQPFCRC
jgi:hypothetical protein